MCSGARIARTTANEVKSSSTGDSTNTLLAMLSSEERAVLEFERAWWLEPGPKDQAIEFALGLSAAAYYEILRSLVRDRRALEFDPLTIKRVHRLMTLKTPTVEATG